jgi:hypothetical protein
LAHTWRIERTLSNQLSFQATFLRVTGARLLPTRNGVRPLSNFVYLNSIFGPMRDLSYRIEIYLAGGCQLVSGVFGFPLRSDVRRQLGLVSDQPRCDGEQRTYGNSTHQDTHDRLYRSKQAPDWRKDNIAVPHGGVAGRREIEAGFPRSEAS